MPIWQSPLVLGSWQNLTPDSSAPNAGCDRAEGFPDDCPHLRIWTTETKVEWSCQVLRTHHVCSVPPLTSGKVTNVKQHLRVATFFSGLRYSSNPKSMDGYLVQDTLSRDLARYHRHISRGTHGVWPLGPQDLLLCREWACRVDLKRNS